MMFLKRLEDAGRVYSARRAEKGLPPLRGEAVAVPGKRGPVLACVGGRVYTLVRRDGTPVTER